jgi:hypothetical protein
MGLVAPTPALLRARIISTATGFSVDRPLAFPAVTETETIWSLGAALDEAGGVLPEGRGEWIIEILPDIPFDAAWTSCHWWLFALPAEE